MMRMICTVSLALALVATLSFESRGASPAPRAITFTSLTITPAAGASRTTGSVITFVVNAIVNNGPATYQMDFGDGGGLTAPQASNTFTHTYSAPGHYFLIVNIQEGAPGNSTFSTDPGSNIPLTIVNPIAVAKPTNSSTIILDQTRSRIWVVNPDQDTVATFLTTGLPAPTVNEIKVGKNPRTLAQAADGNIWVVSQTHPSISVIEPVSPFGLLHVIPLPHGSAPYGIAMTPDGSTAYVSFQGSGGARMISTTSRATLAETTVPPSARGVSVASDGRVFVTRFISPSSDQTLPFNHVDFTSPLIGNRGEVYEFNGALGHVRTFSLPIDQGLAAADPDFGLMTPPTANTSRGVPNYLTSMVITPDSRSAWIPCKKDNIQRGTAPNRDGRTPGPEVTYRAIVTSLNLVSNTAPVGLADRVDINDSEMPQAACTSPLGDYLFIALQGTNRIQVRDLTKMSGNPSPIVGGFPLNGVGNSSGTDATNGLAPQGLVIDPVTNRLFIQNYMGRTVSVIDTSVVYTNHGVGGMNLPAPLAVVRTVGTSDLNDLLPGPVLNGKRHFYNAGVAAMSLNGYISCAGCHLDGGSDMRVFDFTNRTEGLRNTVMLQGRGNGSGQKHGNVHWSANFDEIQDFENDITNAFGGVPGLSTDTLHAPMSASSNAGQPGGVALDELAAYVNSLDKVARSPFRNADGSLTAAGAAGEAVFKAQNCQQCHGTREFTRSTIFTLATMPPLGNNFANVGTIKAASGQRLGGGALTGIDVPTLKGIWQTAPYFHDGSALTMAAVINAVPNTTPNAHGGMHLLSAADGANLERYMLEIDEIDAPPVPAAQVNDVFLGTVASGRPYSLADAVNGRLAYVDRSYQITVFPAVATGGILIRTAEDDKDSTSASQLTFTVSAGANVYVFYDSRRTSLPTFLNGLTPIGGQDMTISPGLVMNCFQLTNVPAGGGVVTLGGNQQGGPTGALRNYIVVVDDAGAVFEEGPISRSEWVHDQDADGDGLRDEFEATSAASVANLSPWDFDSATAALADEDHLDGTGTQTLFKAQPPLSTGGFFGGGGGGGGCGLGGFEFLLPMLALRLMRLRRRQERP